MNELQNPKRRIALAGSLGAFALLATGCDKGKGDQGGRLVGLSSRGVHLFGGLAMGSSYTVKIAAQRLTETTLAAAQQVVAAALADVVGRMSHYESDSEVSRFNRHPVGSAFAVSAPTMEVFTAARDVHVASQGAFDVALGRTVDEWGFGPTPRERHVLPPQATDRLLQLHRGPTLALDAHAGTLTRQAPVWANLSGIAKGYGVDRAARALQGLGLGDFMVEVGGEIRTQGHNGEGRPWQLAIERPDAMPQRALLVVPLAGRSLATSGDYRNFFMHEGRRYSHEIDPLMAAPVDHALASVSVVAENCMHADAWSTALFVQGPERGPALASQQGLAAYFVLRRSDGSFEEQQTPAFAALQPRPAEAHR